MRRGGRFGARGTLSWCGASVKPHRGKLGVFGGLGDWVATGVLPPPPCADADKAKTLCGGKGGSREAGGEMRQGGAIIKHTRRQKAAPVNPKPVPPAWGEWSQAPEKVGLHGR